MSYISAIRINDEVIVWERTPEGRVSKRFRAPYNFYVKSTKGTNETIYGDKVKRYDFSTSREFQKAREDMQSSAIELFESDIPSEIKILSQHYYNISAPKLNVSFYDIEVDYDTANGFSSVANPYAPINSVALYHQWKKEYVVIAVPPETEKYESSDEAPKSFIDKMNAIAPLPENVRVIFAENERELLMWFLAEIQDSDLICGWNSDFFDCPYIGKRLEKIGKKAFRMLSFDEGMNPSFRDVEIFNGQIAQTLDLSGRISADYMVLFRKYEQAERPSYKLESIADEFLPELPKLKYEGSLHSLYRNNFAHFVRYNLRDTEVLGGFEQKLGYVDLANQMYHMSTGVYKHVTGTLKLAELATINYCHHTLGGLIVNDIDSSEMDSSIQGAYVLDPKTGMHEWVGSVDVKSLYPSGIRSINISPETLRGQFMEAVKAAEEIAAGSNVELNLDLETGDREVYTASKWREILKQRKWAVSGYGTVFDQNKKGIIPRILEDWYNMRIEYQDKKKKAEKAGNKELAEYYDRIQYTYKIKLNSFYGALTNRFFRFFDSRMGESTTGTGRMILKHQCAKANEVLTGEYDPAGEAVVYGDTDSTYFHTFADNKTDAVKIADYVANQINEAYSQFMIDTFLCNEGYPCISAEREIVSDRGIFVDKKRYILHVANLSGKDVDKMKIMGLDTKKTTMPKDVSTKLNFFIERLLKGEDWDVLALDIVAYKDELMNTKNIMSIGLPKGVQNVEDYTKDYEMFGEGAKLPGHVAASIHYNQCLKEFDDKESMPIKSGMKIKVFYLTQKYGKFKSIAIPVDIEQMPTWFEEKFTVDRDAHLERLVDNPLQNILKAIKKDVPSRQSLLTDSLLSFD